MTAGAPQTVNAFSGGPGSVPSPSGMSGMAPGAPGQTASQRAFFPGGPTDNRWMNSTLLLLSQKLRYAARNDKVLEHNLLVISKRLRGLEEKIESLRTSGASGSDAGPVKSIIDEFKGQIIQMRAEINELRETSASREQVAELKALLETINPLDFVTINQAKDLIDARLAKAEKK